MRLVSRLALATGGALLLSFVAVPQAQAITDPESTDSSTTSEADQKTREQLKAEAERRMAEAKAKAAEIRAKAEENKAKRELAAQKLDAAKQRICEKRQTVITNVMTRMNNRGQKHLDLITTVSTKVQEFKNSKDLTVENYDTLLASVESSKTAAQTAVDAVKNTQVEFKCDGTDPKGVASSFKEAVRSQNEALKAYRDSVKDLIKAVRHANGTQNTSQQQEGN
jgi:hypothetical protein